MYQHCCGGELRSGAYKFGSARLAAQVNAILAAIGILPLEELADHRYGEIRSFFQSRGEVIGPNDMLIADDVMALDFTVVTANKREYARILRLKAENWMEA
jgi:tRNA(fMet)-specific endonuclease VapC